ESRRTMTHPPRAVLPCTFDLLFRAEEVASRARKLHKRLHTHRTHDEEQVVLNGKSPRAGILQSPLTDSNRRPPPYHRRLAASVSKTVSITPFCCHHGRT